ncbi:MAG: endopeptidase La [marine benthic group bacterium]|jgi:ATP-dependent Lon protease|nr:endopeptidase La [Gemmatimonadota bacterium]MCL7990451.1 endopeptidase La [Gemmatimonadota bacterium]
MIDRYNTSPVLYLQQGKHVLVESDDVEIAWDPEDEEHPQNGDGEELPGRLRLPVLPLRGTVVFPSVAAPIAAGRDKTVAAIDSAMDGDRLLFAVAQKDAAIEEPTPESLHRVGTIVRIAQVQKVPGGIQLVVQGVGRGSMLEIDEKDGYLEAVVRRLDPLQPIDAEDAAFAALYKEVQERAAQLSRLRGVPKEIVDHLLGSVTNPGEMADLIAFYTELEAEEKQELLETLSVEERLRKLLLHLQRQIGLLEAQAQIRSKVQEELGERQREIFLREQMKAIQSELGDDADSEDIEELKERLDALDLPEEARAEVDRELRRLERIPREAAESQVIRTFLETVADLPWDETTDDRFDLELAEEILERDHYGLKDVKDRVLDFLAVRKLQSDRAAEREAAADSSGSEPESEEGESTGDGDTVEAALKGQPDDRTGSTILFVGPPGVGKTSIAKSIADAMGRKYVRVSLGGARDEADIRGHRRTYVGALPGRIIEGLKRAGSKNPVFLLDEVDKLGVSFQGDPSAALMEVLDPAQNEAFVDHYLGIPFDLSDVMFIATANFPHQIPGPLKDRMEAIEFAGYTENEKLEIAKRYLLPRQEELNGLRDDQLVVEDEAIREIISSYTREAGVRNLERELGSIARKSARRIASGEAETVSVGADELRDLIGQPKVHPAKKLEEDTVGVATGMYYTPFGGDIMLVECSVMPGRDGLVLTGQLGDVMKESARAGLTYARTHADALGIPEEKLKDHEIHIHVPAGAVPKEGPSAGIAMSIAMISALSERPVRADVAMTGELTLSGRVLAIGGVKEKVLGAQRAGIQHIILPKDNEGDLDDLPQETRETLDFHLAETLDDAMEVALLPTEGQPAEAPSGGSGEAGGA